MKICTARRSRKTTTSFHTFPRTCQNFRKAQGHGGLGGHPPAMKHGKIKENPPLTSTSTKNWEFHARFFHCYRVDLPACLKLRNPKKKCNALMGSLPILPFLRKSTSSIDKFRCPKRFPNCYSLLVKCPRDGC